MMLTFVFVNITTISYWPAAVRNCNWLLLLFYYYFSTEWTAATNHPIIIKTYTNGISCTQEKFGKGIKKSKYLNTSHDRVKQLEQFNVICVYQIFHADICSQDRVNLLLRLLK